MDGKEIQVLSSGMHDFLNRRIAHDLPEGIKRAAGLDCREIDDGRGRFCGNLNEFELGHKTVFAYEFRIEREARAVPKLFAEIAQYVGACNVVRW